MTALLEVAFLKLFYQVCAEQVPSFGPYSVLLHVGLSRGLSITIFAVDVSAPQPLQFIASYGSGHQRADSL